MEEYGLVQGLYDTMSLGLLSGRDLAIMDDFLPDSVIQELLDEEKHLDRSADQLIKAMSRKSHRGRATLQYTHRFSRTTGTEKWQIYLRQNTNNPFDSSCGLGIIPEGMTQTFTLVRYNGKSHKHTNHLENKESFYDFHIHRATEMYQKSFYDNDHHADITRRYTTLQDALLCLLSDCHVKCLQSDQRDLFS